jgi:hypothetical protein
MYCTDYLMLPSHFLCFKISDVTVMSHAMPTVYLYIFKKTLIHWKINCSAECDVYNCADCVKFPSHFLCFIICDVPMMSFVMSAVYLYICKKLKFIEESTVLLNVMLTIVLTVKFLCFHNMWCYCEVICDVYCVFIHLQKT